jgi:putative holliday junction resolvase
VRYLAIDYGLKRTGLALCDKSETFCSPLRVVETGGGLVPAILKAVKDEGIEAIVIGLPMNMDGSEGDMAKKVRAFGTQLAKQCQQPIHFHDERLSSHKAEELLAPADFTLKKKKARLDAIAAAGILQSFLDSRRENPAAQQ